MPRDGPNRDAVAGVAPGAESVIVPDDRNASRRLEPMAKGPDRDQIRGQRRSAGNEEARSDLRSGLKMSAGTAYRIPSESSHASHPRSPSTTRRRMRQDR